MPAARITLAFVVFCSVSAFAQQQPGADVASGNLLAWPAPFVAWTSNAAPLEPWRIIPERPGQANPPKPAQDHLSNREADKLTLDNLARQMGDRHIDVNRQYRWIEVPDAGVLVGADETCLTIRSYVVARDSKDSDSTHPVSESTCQPARRYGLRTSDIRTASQDR